MSEHDWTTYLLGTWTNIHAQRTTRPNNPTPETSTRKFKNRSIRQIINRRIGTTRDKTEHDEQNKQDAQDTGWQEEQMNRLNDGQDAQNAQNVQNAQDEQDEQDEQVNR